MIETTYTLVRCAIAISLTMLIGWGAVIALAAFKGV